MSIYVLDFSYTRTFSYQVFCSIDLLHPNNFLGNYPEILKSLRFSRREFRSESRISYAEPFCYLFYNSSVFPTTDKIHVFTFNCSEVRREVDAVW